MNKIRMFFIFIFILGWSNVCHAAATSLPDEPAFKRDLSILYQGADSYGRALNLWKTAEDINSWIAGSFLYDKVRAIKLSSNQRTKDEGIPIYTPSKIFESKAGVCVDLARFGVETLRIIDPNSDPKYLMIEFDPIQIDGNTFRLHWLVSFKRDGMTYFFCDSKRPGYIAGPYKNTEVFISEYERYRGRKIVAHRELESYQKQQKTQSTKARVTKSPNKPNAADR
jgi:hypothetical protein